MLLDDGGCGQLNKIIPEETDRKQDGPAATRGCFFYARGVVHVKKGLSAIETAKSGADMIN